MYLVADSLDGTQREATNFHPENVPIGTVACTLIVCFGLGAEIQFTSVSEEIREV